MLRINVLRVQQLSLLLRLLLILWCSWSLLACTGFTPRTAGSPTVVPLKDLKIFIQGSRGSSDFKALLQQGLQASGAVLLSEPGPDIISLDITDVREDRTVSAYSAVRQVREFNHYIELDFIAQYPRQDGQAPRDRTQVSATVRAERSQVYDSRYVLGVSEEERVLQDELRAEAVRLLVLRLSVLRGMG